MIVLSTANNVKQIVILFWVKLHLTLVANNQFFRAIERKKPFYPGDIKIHKRKLNTSFNLLKKERRKTSNQIKLKFLAHDKLCEKRSNKISALYDEVMMSH